MKKRALKRLGAGLLAAVMVLGMGMTAFADEPNTYKLTINPNNYVAVPEDSDDPLAQRFEAFQIFSGTVIQGSTGTADNYGTIDDGELGNVAWGANVTNKEGLVKALAGSNVTLSSIGIGSDKLAAAGSIYSDKTTLGDLFTARLTDAGYSLDEMDFTSNKVAMTIGQVLSDFTANGNNSALAEAFAKIAANHVGNGTKSSWNDAAWEITLTGGYYIVKDNGGEGVGGENNDKVFSDFLVGVFGATTVNVKANAPDVEKVIVNPGNNANEKGSDFEQGKIITFKLTGTLPSNYGNFDTYKYVFHDTFSDGISYIDGSEQVVVKTNGSEKPITPSQIKTTGLSDGCKIEFVFDDLKTIDSTIKAESEIIVTYNAYLNDAASLTKDANTNKVHIEYSNNPNGSGTTETRNEKVVYVDTFGMKIHKYDASIAYDNYLEGAGFVLKSGSDYAIYRGVDGNPVSTYDLVGWLSNEKVTALVDGDWKNANDTINGFIQGADHDGLTTSDSEDDLDAGTYYIVLESKADKDMQVEGLNEGTYTLEEVYAPDGFDPIDPITVKYEATYFGDGETGPKGTMKSLKATVGGIAYDIIQDGQYVNNHDNNVAAFTVANYPVMKAPGTGGAGTYLIYGIGAVLVIVAGAAFVITGRKKREA